MSAKRCIACTAAARFRRKVGRAAPFLWTCRDCGCKVCDHFAGSKDHDRGTATCGSCRLNERKLPCPSTP